MKNVNLYVIAALGIVTLAACDNDDGRYAYAPKNITVQAIIGTMTKVQTTGNTAVFEVGDSISLYVWTGSATAVADTKVVDGVRNGLGADGKWTPKTQMFWADMNTPHYFLGIYPPRNVTNFSADEFTLNPADYEASDLLLATNVTGIKAADNPVNLSFDHVMAKLNVNLSFRDQWESTPTVSSVKVTAKGKATVDYLSKTLTALDAAAGIDLTTSDNTSWSGLQIPQTGVTTITISIDGKDYVFTHTADIPLASGHNTTVNLIIGRNRIELANVAISNWLEGTTIDNGEAQTDQD